jgi:outer membrane lipopolysaccharide assembly protein LptE/RlpB
MAGCDFQLRDSGEVMKNWELIKYTLEIALKLPSNKLVNGYSF